MPLEALVNATGALTLDSFCGDNCWAPPFHPRAQDPAPEVWSRASKRRLGRVAPIFSPNVHATGAQSHPPLFFLLSHPLQMLEDDELDALGMDEYCAGRLGLVYAWRRTWRICSVFLFPPDDITLGNPQLLDGLVQASPAACRVCLMPHFRIEALPDVSFTLVAACPHHEDVAEHPLHPNNAVANILPHGCADKTCRGNIVVFKHSHPPGNLLDNRALPVVDVVDNDLPHLDAWVSRWVLRAAT
ncbi:hypothetical protein C8R47DRAFT_1222725 [Mycena vitilis]|nr:hypothetical protein C8R47DRAFT_1222725 [Mycena vitilis]